MRFALAAARQAHLEDIPAVPAANQFARLATHGRQSAPRTGLLWTFCRNPAHGFRCCMITYIRDNAPVPGFAEAMEANNAVARHHL